NLEGEGGVGRALAQYVVVEIVAGQRQQRQGAAKRSAVAAGSVADGEAPGPVENIRRHARGVGFQQDALAVVRGAGVGGQFGACEEAAGASVESEKVVAVD